MIHRFERFSLAIAELNKHWHKLATEEMEPYGLKGPHCVYLQMLFQNPEGLTAPQLCEACGKDKADVSRMMKILEEKGLVCKAGGHQNRYGGVFRLTEQGTEAAEHVKERAIRAVDYAGADLTEEQRTIFYDAMDSIVTRLRELSKEGIPLGEKNEQN